MLQPALISTNTPISYDSLIRNSSFAYFPDDYLDETLMKMRKRFASIVGVDQSFIESLQVVHYKGDSEFFDTHSDAFEGKSLIEGCCGNNRNHTFLLYLNTIPTEMEGFTEFVNLGIKMQPIKRHALYFQNIGEDGLPLRAVDHRGAKLAYPGNIEKWALTVWIRQRDYALNKFDCENTKSVYNKMKEKTEKKEVDELDEEDL